MDTWALGVMLYEMLVGVTPFHSFEMKDLISKINDGRYKLSCIDSEPIYIETCLFLVQSLVMSETLRLPIGEMIMHPFIAEELISTPLSALDIETFNDDMQSASKNQKTNDCSLLSSTSEMVSRFENTMITETDVVLSTRVRDQVRTLLN